MKNYCKELGFLTLLLLPNFLFAGTPAKLVTGNESVTIYSGPSLTFRPIRNITEKTEFAASSKNIQGRDGDYYKILVKFKNGNRQIGFVPTTSPVKIEGVIAGSGEDIDAIPTLFLAKASLQAAFYVFRDSRMYWTLGYMNYPVPNFYLKPFIGQFFTESASSVVGGFSLGTDHFFGDSLSFFSEVGAGMVASPKEGTVFKGSESANALVQASAGLRINAELAAVSFGFGQTGIFNGNNSFVGWNLGFTLEVGL